MCFVPLFVCHSSFKIGVRGKGLGLSFKEGVGILVSLGLSIIGREFVEGFLLTIQKKRVITKFEKVLEIKDGKFFYEVNLWCFGSYICNPIF